MENGLATGEGSCEKKQAQLLSPLSPNEKLLLPSFDRKDLDFVEDQFRHIHEELAMFTAFQTPLPTQGKLIRNGKKVKMIETKEKAGDTYCSVR